MDWVLGITTLAVNTALGYFRGAWWVWVLHFFNAVGWQVYVMATNQLGFTILNVATMGIDLVMLRRALIKRRKDARKQ